MLHLAPLNVLCFRVLSPLLYSLSNQGAGDWCTSPPRVQARSAIILNCVIQALSLLRLPVSGFSLQRPDFDLSVVYLVFVVDKVAMDTSVFPANCRSFNTPHSSAIKICCKNPQYSWFLGFVLLPLL